LVSRGLLAACVRKSQIRSAQIQAQPIKTSLFMIAQVQLKDFVTDFLIEGQRELTLDVAMQA